MISQLQDELHDLLGPGLLELMPFNVAIIDRDFRVVAANRNFEDYFGDWRGRHCHEVCKGSPDRCASCNAESTFADGRVRVSDEAGVDRHGRACLYVVHLAPLRDPDGNVNYVLEMTTDLTESRRWQREYDRLFERVPCYVSIIDRNFRVVRANEKFREAFGDGHGEYCYRLYKRRSSPCGHCPAALTFKDHCEHVSEQTGVRQDGSAAHYLVTTSPVLRGGEVAHVIEIATDISEVRRLEGKLREAHHYYESLIRNAATAIVAVDCDDIVRIVNPAARQLLEWDAGRPPAGKRLRQFLPQDFYADFEGVLEIPETEIVNARGAAVPVRLTAVRLHDSGKCLGRAAFLQDLRDIKRLEREKLDAERLGAVGQTVAGLAHTIKNLLMGLEGGMYMVDSGLRRGDAARIAGGWEVLQRNFEKITNMVKDFLGFAKGRLPELKLADPNALAAEIVELYRDAASRQGVELVFEAGPEVGQAPLDPEGMETCLTNLVSNGIDAAILREEPGGRVVLRTRDTDGEIVFEVADNGCGMDWEVKGKVFTTFFTTKGGKGTGLGLLTTRKIVQEHGGRIEVESSPGQGSVLRIRLPRKRLEALAASLVPPAGQTSP
jgi:signal transduction histidine kinase